MRITLLILGGLLILQVAASFVFGIIALGNESSLSFQAVGALVDKNLLRLTAGLSAYVLAELLVKYPVKPKPDSK